MKRAVVAFSGGVDSAVAALLLRDQGYDIVPVFVKSWDQRDETRLDDTGSSAVHPLRHRRAACDAEIDAAQRAAGLLKLRLHVLDCTSSYWHHVFEPFVKAWERGVCFNPDLFCNSRVKFAGLRAHAFSELGADVFATGHYARVASDTMTRRHRLLTAAAQERDQTYFLAALQQDQLDRVVFPLGSIPSKEAVKQIAVQRGLESVAQRRSSTGICFVGPRKFKTFLGEYVSLRPGGTFGYLEGSGTTTMLLDDKKYLSHDGAFLYAIGERVVVSRPGTPYLAGYVYARDLDANQVFLCERWDHPKLYHSTITFGSVSCIHNDTLQSFESGLRCRVKCRSRQNEVLHGTARWLDRAGGTLSAVLEDPCRAPTPGQAVVLYSPCGNECLGCGWLM